MKSKRWHHYKDNKLIGVMDWDSLPDICHKWWEQAQIPNNHFSKLKKEDLVFCYDNLRVLDSFDEYDSCQMPYCLAHCDTSENLELSSDYTIKQMNHGNKWAKEKYGIKYRDLSDEQWIEYKDKYSLPHWTDTKEYLISLRKHLNKRRDMIIDDIESNQAYEEYIIYK